MAKGQKLQQVMNKYGVESLADELVERWTDSDDADSLHELEQFVNKRIVQKVINEQLEGFVPEAHPSDRIARLLRADGSSAERFDDVSQVEIMEVRNWLRENNIDTEELAADLVSYSTIYQYLHNIRETDASENRRQAKTPEERQERVIIRLSNLHQRVEAVTKQSLESLVNTDVLPGTYDIRLQFRIECTECDRRQDLLEYIRKRGCTSCDANNRS